MRAPRAIKKVSVTVLNNIMAVKYLKQYIGGNIFGELLDDRQEYCGILWNFVECCGTLWNVVEFCGILQNFVELWDFVEFCGMC
jgi:hypothetical protein